MGNHFLSSFLKCATPLILVTLPVHVQYYWKESPFASLDEYRAFLIAFSILEFTGT
jgi:hypothetical protein